MLYCRFTILYVLDRALSRMIPHLCPFEFEVKVADMDEMAYNSKQHEELTRYVILFVLKYKTESTFHLR